MVQINDPNQKFFVKTFQKGLRVGPFSDSLALSRLASMTEIRARTEKYVEAEEDRLHVEKAMSVVRKKSAHGFQTNHQYILRGTSRAHILKEVYHLQLLDIPPPTQHQLGPSQDEWCEFHRARSHLTEECRLLKSQIEKLIQDGYLATDDHS
ncbi:hypothetical protein CR513_02003, partial [Mucuna pruriens]